MWTLYTAGHILLEKGVKESMILSVLVLFEGKAPKKDTMCSLYKYSAL